MRTILILHMAFLFFSSLPVASPAAGVDSTFIRTEQKLKILADSILRGSSDAARQGALAEFNPVFWDLLNTPGAFEYGFDSLTTVSKIRSADRRVRILTWILPSRNGDSYTYYGVLQVAGKENQAHKTYGLTESKMATDEAVLTELKPGTWYGAVYYDIVETRSGKQTLYTLIGWHGNNRQTTRKVIDVLTIDPYGDLTFGVPVFATESEKYACRVIFEFNAGAVMLLRYEPKMKMIVFDHLSPSSPGLKGRFEHYGPDFTYDGYRFRKGKWELKKNLELKNPSGG